MNAYTTSNTRVSTAWMIALETFIAGILSFIAGFIAMKVHPNNISVFNTVAGCVYLLYMAYQHQRIFARYELSTVASILLTRSDEEMWASNRQRIDRFESLLLSLLSLPVVAFLMESLMKLST